MPTTIQTIHMRNRSREAARRSPARWLGLSVGILVSLVVAAAGLYLAFEYAGLTQDLPPVDALPSLFEPPNGFVLQPTRLYDRTGTHLLSTLENPAAGERRYLYYPSGEATPPSAGSQDLLPTSLISATLASSEITSTNLSPFSLFNPFSDQRPSIASRLATGFLLENEPVGWRRSLRGNLLAIQIAEAYGREKVIEWYLNSANFGRMAYGAAAASQLYFARPAQELDFSEAALLVATAEDPSLNPIDAPQAASTRQKQIVQEALRTRMLSPDEGIKAFREEPKIAPSTGQEGADPFAGADPGFAPAYLRLALDQLTARIPRETLERGGLRVYTTLDYDLQSQIDCTSRVQQQRLQAIQGENPAGIPADCPAARLLPSLPFDAGQASENLSMESIVIDPLTGQILAMNSVFADGKAGTRLGEHPAGSLGTLFVYMTGFTRGLSPASLLWDIPSQEGSETTANYHGPVRLRVALANDYLAPAESVLTQVGVENVWHTSQQLGIEFPETDAKAPDSVLEIFRPMDLVEASHALSAFANQGNLAGRAIDPTGSEGAPTILRNPALPPLQSTTILRVDDTSGRIRLDWDEPQTRPILSSSLAYLMTNVLSDETARWPSLGHPNPLEIGRPAAAKIGGTLDGKNNWVIGYTPKRVVGVWTGPQTQARETANLSPQDMNSAAAGLWHAIMQYANQELPYEDFNMPPGLSIVQVCDPSGLLPTAACPNVVDEVFLNGNEPVQIDTLYRLVAINRDTGRLATIFTPPDLVDERAYIIVPPEAQKWARQTGLDTPPETYDALPAQIPEWPDTKITSPQMFANLRGKTTITGRASGAGFSFYRLQYGKGPDPSEWFQIESDSQKPVTDGRLAVWDTSKLDGLYAVQLLLVRNDQSAERATLLVTVDNQPPEVTISRPLPGETILRSERARIVLQTEVSDNLAVTRVELDMDGRPIATLTQPPYAVSWTVTPGQHTFRVTAVDGAGNQGQTQVEFSAK